MKMSKSTGKAKRPTGYGKAMDSPSVGREKAVNGETDRGSRQGKGKKSSFDGGYGGNVTGPYSKPVKF